MSSASEGVSRTPGDWLGLSLSPHSSSVWPKLFNKAAASQEAKQKLPGNYRPGLKCPEGHLPSILLVKSNFKARPGVKEGNRFLLLNRSSHKDREEVLGA